MGSVGSPQTWVPYGNIKDCSQGFCSSYCPQWCYIIFPPPPPYEFPDEASNPNFSPLVIAIIGILASAFLLASYYILISKYCGRNNVESLRRTGNHDPSEEFDENRDSMNNESWQASTEGLDETLIKSITVCKYNKGDGLVKETDCSVCLNEFQEEERLRLLPKCSHAFHLTCIDTWLRVHSNCPLCRANIVIANPLPLQLLSPVHESPPEDVPLTERRRENNDAVVAEEVSERGDGEEDSEGRDAVPKSPLRGSSDLGQLEGRDTIIEIRDERFQYNRRSVSMDYSCQSQISTADILGMSEDDDSELEDNQFQTDVGSLKLRGEHSKSNNKSRPLHCVMSPIAMKRSFSSGRLFFTRHGRGRNTMIPM
ncbi:E3 ubiquitin-protein ligase Os04g0590900-like [Macadamia integrifolia]|uniref:E3 ubiquitin-protein ligase Os04g0590900-like n=1 Tax=Macadamia integrifolia TaxID=60698 RepID=UPI001C4F9841|nr:E3 ubiquitin-protein ligase Os04g0590900-like [Macadamia integrifolia]